MDFVEGIPSDGFPDVSQNIRVGKTADESVPKRVESQSMELINDALCQHAWAYKSERSVGEYQPYPWCARKRSIARRSCHWVSRAKS